MGTVAGSLLTGLFLVPVVGIFNSILIGLLLNLILAGLILSDPKVLSRFHLGITAVIVILCSWVFFKQVNAERWANTVMLSDIPRKLNRDEAPKDFEQFLEGVMDENWKVLYYKEGIAGTIVVTTNGKSTFRRKHHWDTPR